MTSGMLRFPLFRAAVRRFNDLHVVISCRSHSTIAKAHSSATRLHINCMFCSKFSDRFFSKYIQTLSSHQKKCYSHLFISKLPNFDLEAQFKLDTAHCRQPFHTYSYLRTVKKENLSLHTRDVHEYIDSPDTAILEMLKDDFIVYDDFITEEEENSIFQEIEPYLNRLKYEHNHWDDAIHGFRETERKKWTERNKGIIQRVRDVAFPAGVQQLAYVHILDIKKAGYIKPHVDAVRMRCYRMLLNITYKDHITNLGVHRKIQAAIGKYDKLLTLVKKQKLRWLAAPQGLLA